MCNNCFCDNITKCSIIGYLPIGFCCESCEKKMTKKNKACWSSSEKELPNKQYEELPVIREGYRQAKKGVDESGG